MELLLIWGIFFSTHIKSLTGLTRRNKILVDK